MPRKTKPREQESLLKSIFLAYFILFLHVLLIGGIAVLVLFFAGFVHYLPWIMLGTGALVLVSGYRVYSNVKKGKNALGDILSDPQIAGRSVEVSLFGGMAAFRLGAPETRKPVLKNADPLMALEGPRPGHVRELAELARMLEDRLITRDEFEQAKKKLLV